MSTEQPNHEIILVQTLEERQQCFDVRIEVFHHEQKFPLETEIDDMEDVSSHFLLRLTPSLRPIGTIRGYKVEKPGTEKSYYKLSRLAVLKEYRHFKFGRALVERLHNWVIEDAMVYNKLDGNSPKPFDGSNEENKEHMQTVQIISHSQIPVKNFYAKFGYEPEGAEFDEDGDPHQKMVLRMQLPASANSLPRKVKSKSDASPL